MRKLYVFTTFDVTFKWGSLWTPSWPFHKHSTLTFSQNRRKHSWTAKIIFIRRDRTSDTLRTVDLYWWRLPLGYSYRKDSNNTFEALTFLAGSLCSCTYSCFRGSVCRSGREWLMRMAACRERESQLLSSESRRVLHQTDLVRNLCGQWLWRGRLD